MTKTVVIYGGGMAGANLARALEDKAEVTLVSPLDYFEVPMALPRNLVQPDFANRSVVPFAETNMKVRHVQGRLVTFEDGRGTVETPDGENLNFDADVSVLATGSRYANAMTRAQEGTAASRREGFAEFAAKLKQAEKIVIVGGGPIGIELAGEITTDFPGKKITVIESNADILKGTSRKVAARAKAVLQRRGVEFHLNQRVTVPAYGDEPAGGTAETNQGLQVPYDLIFWAVGSTPNTSYLVADQLTDDRRIPVDDHLQVKGMEGVFALGDITDLNEVKKAIYVNSHIKVAAKNIEAILKGQQPKAVYKAQTGNDIMFVTLGRNGGVAHLPGLGMIKANWMIRMGKARDMLVGMYRKKVGAAKTS